MIASGIVSDIKYIISINKNQNKDIHIVRGFYGLLDVRYKSIDILKKSLNKKILKQINNNLKINLQEQNKSITFTKNLKTIYYE